MKTAIVTGAGRGLGYCITKDLLSRGYVVGGILRKSNEDFDQLLKDYPDTLIPLYADVTDIDALNKTYEIFSSKVDRLDVIFNVAAIMIPEAELPLHDPNISFDKMLVEYDVNALGPIRVVKAYLPLIEATKACTTCINISSEAGSIGYHFARTNEYAYQMSKSALNFATKILNQAYCTMWFRAWAVDPGWMRTDMGGQAASLDPNDSAREIVDLAESDNKPYFYMNRKGMEYKW